MKATKIETNFSKKKFFSTSTLLSVSKYKNQEKKLINIYPSVEFQKILGFGGAFTEASGYCLKQVNENIRNNILQDYFSKEGLGYSFCRTPIGSTDFSLKSFSYLKNEKIENFSIDKDKEYIIPMIKEALKINPNITLLASPWSPPAFMKNTKIAVLGGKLSPKYYSLYSNYLCKYIEEYKKEHIDIKYITVQNEPNAVQLWESCLFSPEEEFLFATEYLYSSLKRNNLHTQIICWDHNKEKLFSRSLNTIGKDKYNAISGMAMHWYSGDYFEELALTHLKFPNALLIHTEGCTGFSNFRENDEIQNGEIYGHDIIGDLNNGINAFIDWNMILDNKGGPNHKKNYCNAPIMLNKDNSNYIKNLTFYYIGHFSRYIHPGATRIGFSKFTDALEVTAFKNIDSSTVVVIMNKTNDNIEFNINLNNELLKDVINSHSIITYTF